jgi:hypothetical protein
LAAEEKPALPRRPAGDLDAPEPNPPRQPADNEPDEIQDFWGQEAERQQKEYEAEQIRLQRQWDEQQRLQLAAQEEAQRAFEDQQRQQAEQQRQAQEQLLREQYQAQTQGRLAELERENLAARAQYDSDQLLLSQYDLRMKALEDQLQQLVRNYEQKGQSKDEQIASLQEQLNVWRSKYEALARLYSQLRQEHLDVLQSTRSLKKKAASAQEAIERRERLERELKTKNLELADMIRERDRALTDRDRAQGSSREDRRRLERELAETKQKLQEIESTKASELSSLIARHNRELVDLEDTVRRKSQQLEDLQSQHKRQHENHNTALQEKESEVNIYRDGMEQALEQLEELRLTQDPDGVLDAAIDQVVKTNSTRIDEILDSVLESGVQRVDDAIYELDSPMQAGNQNATAPYLLSQIERASAGASDFAMAFNNFVADPRNSAPADVIRTVSVLAAAVADVLSNTKGLTSDEKMVNAARDSAQATITFFRNLLSFRLEGLEPAAKTTECINSNHDLQVRLQKLSKLADAFAPRPKLDSNDLGSLVDSELTKAADAIDAAAKRLSTLKQKPRDGFSTYQLQIHDVIVETATALTAAIAQLIKAATASQQEIVRAGRGSSSRAAFYKKNNRWTEGLISAAKAVAASTNTLIEVADGCLAGNNIPEELIVASNDVAASTAQLVAASRVKAAFMSETQDQLEQASRAVGAACRSLVRQVQDLIQQKGKERKVDYTALSTHQLKTREMEQQVSLLFPTSTRLTTAGRDTSTPKPTRRRPGPPFRNAQDFLPRRLKLASSESFPFSYRYLPLRSAHEAGPIMPEEKETRHACILKHEA